MSIVYLTLLFVLTVVHFLVRRRVGRLERRFSAVAAEADAVLKQNSYRGGNCCRPDPYQAAKQQFELARLAMKRDRIEDRYTRSQAFSERFGRFRARLSGYRGKLLPYAVGVFDVVGLVFALDRFGLGVSEIRSLLGV
jgi:hypothetical protein